MCFENLSKTKAIKQKQDQALSSLVEALGQDKRKERKRVKTWEKEGRTKRNKKKEGRKERRKVDQRACKPYQAHFLGVFLHYQVSMAKPKL